MNWLRTKLREWLGVWMADIKIETIHNTHSRNSDKLWAEISVLRQDLSEANKQIEQLRGCIVSEPERTIARPKTWSAAKRALRQEY
jgi:hypothetical protein